MPDLAAATCPDSAGLPAELAGRKSTMRDTSGARKVLFDRVGAWAVAPMGEVTARSGTGVVLIVGERSFKPFSENIPKAVALE